MCFGFYFVLGVGEFGLVFFLFAWLLFLVCVCVLCICLSFLKDQKMDTDLQTSDNNSGVQIQVLEFRVVA